MPLKPKPKVVEMVETLDQMEERLTDRLGDLVTETQKTEEALDHIKSIKAITFHSVR